jgi:hypothetical protein
MYARETRCDTYTGGELPVRGVVRTGNCPGIFDDIFNVLTGLFV